LGEITHQEVWADFCKSLGQDVDYNVLIDSFKDTRLDDKMISLVKKLNESYLIGMVTDDKCEC